ncbi:MAG: radical SAM protein [Aurantibacter sp.]
MISQVRQTCTNEMARKNDFLDGFRVIHLHPTLRCNLKCHHCYSSSAPGLKKELGSKEIVQFLKYAWSRGFNALSVSGGEPFLYSGLEDVLRASKEIGYKNLVASNGMLLKTSRAKQILKLIDLIAISIDGDEKLHDEIRGLDGAYSKMLEGIGIVREMGLDFGLIHTLREPSWEILLWLSKFAYTQGAKLLQLHPLEQFGRAKTEIDSNSVTQELLHKVFVLGNYLKGKYYPRMTVQLDFLHRDYISEYPQTATYFGTGFQVDKDNFAKAIKTIVIDENGNILPISYGFSGHFKIGNIMKEDYKTDLFEKFLIAKWESLYDLLEYTFGSIIQDSETDLVPWTELIVENSNKFNHQKQIV